MTHRIHSFVFLTIAALSVCIFPAHAGGARASNWRDGAEMIEIPAGEFLMGSAADATHTWGGETPQRRVHLDTYWIYRHPVTVAQFRRYTEQTGAEFDWAGREPAWGWIDDHPMVRVSWSDAANYAAWAGLSLPTEAQWEKAARGSDGRIYPWSNQWDAERCNNVLTGPYRTTPVGSFPRGASPFGVEDMAGNVEEWCFEAYAADYHVSTSDTNPIGPLEGDRRVVRGGSWLYSGDDWNFRAAARYRFPAGAWFHYYGFRLATPAPGIEPATVAPAPPPALPDPLRLEDGTPVDTAEQWHTQRRPEILELFRSHVYGRWPVQRPDDLAFTVTEDVPDAMDGQALRKRIEIRYAANEAADTFELLLFIPSERAGPVPVFLLINHRDVSNMDPNRETRRPFWPAEEIVARGYAAAVFHAPAVAAVQGEAFDDGVYAVFGPFGRPRAPDEWGALAAWAWGASRVMDYLETDPDLATDRVAVVGHSRGGKAALWAGAKDQRFALAVSNQSGTGGAAMTREKRWGGIADQVAHFPNWYCDNYRAFAGRHGALPVDQHMLIALMAPRRVYVASATRDSGQDPESEFRSCVEAGPVFRLLGVDGLESRVMFRPDVSMHAGHIGHHMRTGGHDLTSDDWQRFMDYTDRHGWRNE